MPLRHTVRLAGAVTGALARLGAGGSLGLRGPFGTPLAAGRCRGRDVVVAAGGIGLAPLRPVIEAVLADPAAMVGCRCCAAPAARSTCFMPREYPAWRRCGACGGGDRGPGAVRAGWGTSGVLPLLMDRLPLSNPDETVLLVCGPQVMMTYTVQSAQRRGVAPTSGSG